jgi:hypothetical protein
MKNISLCKFALKNFLRAIVCLVIILALSAMPAVASSSGYNSSLRPLTSFMKVFQNVTAEDLSIAELAHKLHNKPGFTTDDLGELSAAGEKFYKSCKNEFDQLYKDSGKILSEQPKSFSAEKLKSAEMVNSIDYRFSRNIARCFKLVALYHFKEKNYEQAVKTLLLCNWFSHSIARGENEVPVLIDLMISIAIRKIAISELLWSSLAQGEFSQNWLVYAEKSMAELETSQPSFAESMEWELFKTLSFIKKELNSPNSDLQSHNFAKSLSREKRAEIANKSIEIIYDRRKQIVNLCTAYRLVPTELSKEMDKVSNSLIEEGKLRITDILTPEKKVAQIMEAITTPNFSKAYDQYLQVRYLEKGTILFIRFLTRRKKGEPLPMTLADFETVAQARIPLDLYASNKSKCLYSVDKEWMTLYSIGRNRFDNKGDQEEDFILFKVPVKFLNQQ